MYADNITESMQRTIDETARRRSIQLQYNADHGITPKQIEKAITSALPTSADKEDNYRIGDGKKETDGYMSNRKEALLLLILSYAV